MPNNRDENLMTCEECGGTVSPAGDRVFALGCEAVLCMECTLRRGGVYDETDDRWTVAPKVDDLLERAEASSQLEGG